MQIIVIPDSINDVQIRKIGDSAFNSLAASIVLLPDCIKSIGNYAFANNNIYYIKFPKNLEYIGDYAFYKNNISHLDLNDNLKRIGNFAFALNKLTDMNFLSKDIELGFACFNQNMVDEDSAYIYKSFGSNDKYELLSYAGKKVDIVVPEGVVKIANYAFSSCDVGDFGYRKINSVSLPNSLKIIGHGAFENNNLTTLNIGPNVIYVGRSAFKNNKLSKLTFQNIGDTYLGTQCFNDNLLSDDMAYIITTKMIPEYVYDVHFDGKNLVTSLPIGEYEEISDSQDFFAQDIDSVRTLVSYAGKNRNKLMIPYSIAKIADSACSDLGVKEIIIPTSVTTIENYAFANNNLTTVTIPENIESLGFNVFSNNNISEIKISGKTSIPDSYDESILDLTDNVIFN